MTAKLNSDRADRLIDRARNACYLRLGRWTPIELATNEAKEIARDEAEGVRIAYVAATRARDLLVVPGVGDAPWDGGWTGPLNRAIYPEHSQRRTPAAGPGCPSFKKDSVWRRPDDDPATPTTVAPGLHAFPGNGDGAYSVVWWDPHALDLEREPVSAIRRDALIMKDVPEAVVDEGLREYHAWLSSREAAIVAGSVPSMAVQTVTEWAAATPEADRWTAAPPPRGGARGDVPAQPGLFDEPEAVRRGHGGDDFSRAGGGPAVALVDARGPERPGGARFGELVHAVLASAPLDAGRSEIDGLIDVHGRLLSAPDDERAAARETVERVLGHDLLARARRAGARGACRRETPVTRTLADGTMLEGIVDLAFEQDGVWTVVDYKTDREIAAAGEARYRRQVALYAEAISEATGAPASGVIVRI
jgi:ATP-dependent helicase/nuclease subunit A